MPRKFQVITDFLSGRFWGPVSSPVQVFLRELVHLP